MSKSRASTIFCQSQMLRRSWATVMPSSFQLSTSSPAARIVERLLLCVEDDKQVGEPRALGCRDAVARDLGQLVALAWRHAAELGHDAAALQSLHDPRWRHELGLVALEIRLAGLEILLPTPRLPALALLVLHKHERAGAEHMRFRELWVLGQLHCTVDAVPGRGEIRQHRRIRPLQTEDDGQRVGRVYRRDGAEIDLSR